jgi:hypothetical protein
MSQVVLNNKPGTNFYAPAAPGPGELMLFLQWSGTTKSSITVEQAWDPLTGFIGYFLFLNAMPPDGNLKAVETAVRAALPEELPSSSCFAWVTFQTNWSVSGINPLLLQTTRGVDWTTTADFATPPSPPFPSIPIDTGTPVGVSHDGQGFIDGFVVLYPPQPTSEPPTGEGINLPITGSGVGCFRFQGLMNANSQVRTEAAAHSVLKEQVEVSLDPLNLFDTSRTFIRFTGEAFVLTEASNGTFSILPAGTR